MKPQALLGLLTSVTIGLQSGDAAFGQAAAPVEVPGLLKMEVWNGLSTSDNSLDGTLLADPRYPATPDAVFYTTGFTSRPVYPDDTHEGYGGKISGYVIPPSSGNYRFFIYSDDSSRLFLSSDDKPAGLAEIAREDSCCNNFTEPDLGTTRTSEPVSLVAGKRYYVEAIWKEGNGGDYMLVAWRKEGDATAAASLPTISPAYVAVSVPAQGSVTIATQPANASAAQNDSVSFKVAVTTTNSPVLVQWQRNGATLPGVTGATLTLDPVSASDNGAKYRALISTPGAIATSDEATLTVTPDVTPPVVATLVGSASYDSVTLSFSEAVSEASAAVAGNYKFDGGLSVTAAAVVTPNQVRLTTSKQTAGTTYTLTVTDVADTSGLKVAAGTKKAFTAFSRVKGGLQFSAFLNYTGTLADLPSDPRYPNQPDIAGYTTSFTSRTVFTDDSHNNYGARLSGWIVPTETASYEFFLRSDDPGQLYLSQDDNPDNAVLIAEETSCCNPFMDPGTGTQTSEPQALVAGKAYAIYGFWRDGTGGDYLDIAWRKVGDTTVAKFLPYIPGNVLYSLGAPDTFTPPTIAVATPTADQVFDLGVPVVLTSTAASTTNKTIVKVEYFESKQKIGEATKPPFTLTLEGLREDTHTVVARAMDSAGITTESAPVTFSVGGQRERVVLAAIDDQTVWKYDRSGTDLGTAWREKSFDDSKWPSGKALIADESTTTVEPIRTPISRFDDGGTHITTFYYRKHFTLNAPVTAGIKLQLRHVVDDGAVFYINGTEIHRFGIAADATFDYSTFFADHENAYAGPYDIPPSVLVQGDNIFAVEVHQTSAGSSDMVFGAELVATVPVVPVSKAVLAIDDVTTWKYDRSGTDLGTTWRELAFDDSKWPSGKALIADESTTTVEPIRTPFSRFDDAGTHITTFYFRGRFNLDVDPAAVKLKLRHVVDDGCVVYLNGVEINRLGIAADATYDYSTFFADHENAYAGPFDIPSTALRRGDNVVAVEVHQTSAGSSDIVFGLELVATYPSSGGPAPGNPAKLTITRDGNGAKITWTEGGTLQSSSTASGGYSDVAGASSPYTVTPSGSAKFYRVRN